LTLADNDECIQTGQYSVYRAYIASPSTNRPLGTSQTVLENSLPATIIIAPFTFGNEIIIPANTFSSAGARIYLSITYSNFSGAITMPGVTIGPALGNLSYFNNGTAIAAISGSPNGDGGSYQAWYSIANPTLNAVITVNDTGSFSSYVCNVTMMAFT
jgi:hypothetical protein